MPRTAEHSIFLLGGGPLRSQPIQATLLEAMSEGILESPVMPRITARRTTARRTLHEEQQAIRWACREKLNRSWLPREAASTTV